MDAVNEALRLVGHAISLDKVLTHIARLALDSMLVDLCTHQQTTQTSDVSFGVMNISVGCNWHYIKALHRFLYAQRCLGRRRRTTLRSATGTAAGHCIVFLYGHFFVSKENI